MILRRCLIVAFFLITTGALSQSVSPQNNQIVIPTGADPTGSRDSSSAINTAASTVINGMPANVFLPSGIYHLANMVSLSNGQCLFGESKGNTIITVGADFSSSAAAVVQLSSTQDSGPCIHDITFQLATPPDTVTTTTQSSSASSSTITVASTANILVNGSVTDATAPTAIPVLTTVTSIVGNVVHLSNNVASPGVGNGDSVHFGPSRSTFTTLSGGCTVGVGGTGCEYPPVIQSISNSMRNLLYHIKIQGAWTGISTAVNNVMWLDDIEMSALYIGLAWDNTVSTGTLDFSHIHGYHFWDWGINGTNVYSNVYLDGGTFAAIIGEVDGINVTDFDTFSGRVQLTSNFTWGQFTNVEMDSTNATFEINGSLGGQGIAINNIYSTGATQGSNSNCQLQVNAGSVSVSNIRQANSTSDAICISGGSLGIFGGLENPNTPSVGSIVQTGGVLSVNGIYFNVNTGAGLWTTPLINSSAGTFVFKGNNFNAGLVSDAAAVSTTDSAANSVTGNQFNGWSFSAPGPLGDYNPNAGNRQGGWISYSPSVLAWLSGTLTSGSATGSYLKQGQSICLNLAVAITTAGTANSVYVTLPTSPGANTYVTGAGSSAVLGQLLAGNPNLYVLNAAGGAHAPSNGDVYNFMSCYPTQ